MTLNYTCTVEVYADDVTRLEYPEPGDNYAERFADYVSAGMPEWARDFVVTYDEPAFHGYPDFPVDGKGGILSVARVTFPGVVSLDNVVGAGCCYLPRDIVESVAQPGRADERVADALTDPRVRAALAGLNPLVIDAYLRESGAWDDLDTVNVETRWKRFLWIACGDRVEAEKQRARYVADDNADG